MTFPVPAATNIPFSALPVGTPPAPSLTSHYELVVADHAAYQAAIDELLREERLKALVDELGEAEMEISDDDDDNNNNNNKEAAPALSAPSTTTEAYKRTRVKGKTFEANTAMASYAEWSAEELRVKDYSWGVRFGDPEPSGPEPPSPPQRSHVARFFDRYVHSRSGRQEA
jgi:hypothetical protein